MRVEAGIDDGREAISVEHRQDAEDLVFRYESDALQVLLHIRHEVPVRQHSTLRASCRAGRINQRADVIFGNIFREIRGSRCDFLLCLVVQVMDADGRAGNFQHSVRDEQHGTGIAEDVIHFAVDERIVDRDDNSAKADHCHEYVDEFCAVGGIEAYTFPLADSHFIQRISVAGDCFFQLAIGDDGIAFEHQMRRIGTLYNLM